MQTNERGKEKSAVEYLNFGEKTAKRVEWEAWSFRIPASGQVEVVNESYGVERGAHAYVVDVEEVDGVVVPKTCECPADRFHEDYDCKHKVAVAVVGGEAVLEAVRASSVESTEPTTANV